MQETSKSMDNLDAGKLFALRLHALEQADKDWIVSRLGDDARAILHPLLEELNELGIQVDRHNVEVLRQSSSDVAMNTEVMHHEISLINKASIRQLDIVFDEEPRIFFSYLRSLSEWAWASSSISYPNALEAGLLKVEPSMTKPTEAVKKSFIKAIAAQLNERNGSFASVIKDLDYPEINTSDYSMVQNLLRRLVIWK